MKDILKPVGVWLDYREAYIVKIDQTEVHCLEIRSEIDEEHPVGGSRSSTPYGPQEAVSEHRFLHRRQQQETSYYQSIIKEIQDRDCLYIIGPGQAKISLEREIRNHHALTDKINAVETSQRLTQNQIKSKVMNHFHLLGCSEPARKFD